MDVHRYRLRVASARSRNTGLSLIELILALSLLSILIGVGIPAFNNLIDRVRFDTDIAAVRSALSFARMTAVTRNERVVVCRWNGIDGCTGNRARGAYQWIHGLAVFNDLNYNKTLDEPSESVIRIIPLSRLTNVIWSKGEVVAFNNNGNAPGYNGTFTVDVGQHSAKLILSMTGRLRYDGH